MKTEDHKKKGQQKLHQFSNEWSNSVPKGCCESCELSCQLFKASMFQEKNYVFKIVKDTNSLFQMLDDMVEEIGDRNVIQVLTDNASMSYVKAR